MNKVNYRVKLYKKDSRYKSGKRLQNTYNYIQLTPDELQQILGTFFIAGFTPEKGYRLDYYPSEITVKNLMSGEDVVIDADTPWSCRPDSETYWSM